MHSSVILLMIPNSGKAVADAVLNCLKRSRNGKLNEDTKRVLQEFVLTTVKRNLNLTIVGGAVKTRCEVSKDVILAIIIILLIIICIIAINNIYCRHFLHNQWGPLTYLLWKQQVPIYYVSSTEKKVKHFFTARCMMTLGNAVVNG